MVNIPMLANVPLYAILREQYNVPVELDIDRNGSCLAEYKSGYSRSVERLMYITIGTGVGVGPVVNGQVCRVTNNSIGELGHVPFDVDGFKP
jgi:predicted NBD/HSP70 family sugar kinase